MIDLTDLGHRVLRAITSAPIAWLAPVQIAARLGGKPRSNLRRRRRTRCRRLARGPGELEGRPLRHPPDPPRRRVPGRPARPGRQVRDDALGVDRRPRAVPPRPRPGPGGRRRARPNPRHLPGPRGPGRGVGAGRADRSPCRPGGRGPGSLDLAPPFDPARLRPHPLARPAEGADELLPGLRVETDLGEGVLPRLRPMGPRPPPRRAARAGPLGPPPVASDSESARGEPRALQASATGPRRKEKHRRGSWPRREAQEPHGRNPDGPRPAPAGGRPSRRPVV